MDKYIYRDQSFKEKSEIVDIIQSLETYFKKRAIIKKPNPDTYDNMYDFVHDKIRSLRGISYFPLSKYEKRFAYKLYEVLSVENALQEAIIKNRFTEKREYKLYNTRKELFTVIFSNIYLEKNPEKKLLNSFNPDELVWLCDLFEEEIVKDSKIQEDEQRTEELAGGIGGDDDETDVAATFYDRLIDHHSTNRPIGTILEDVIHTRNITYAHLFKKTIENADILQCYFGQYYQIFIISYCTLLTYEQMCQAIKKIFPKEFDLPDTKSYIDRRYERENADEKYDEED